MTDRHMTLAILLGGSGTNHGAWRREGSRVEEVATLGLYAELAAVAERAKLDMVFVADNVQVDRTVIRAGQMTQTGYNGHLEPMTLLSALAARTEHIGLAGTLSTSFTEPYNAARQMASLDHLSGGRAAWNMVTSMVGEENFGRPLAAHDERYVMADEFVEVMTRLWDSWADDAIVVDRSTGLYADPDRIRELAFTGTYFSVAGALNVPRSPQGWPVLVQAGSSPTGMAFASRWAEVVFTAQREVEDIRTFDKSLRDLVVKAGRRPDSVKILPGLSVIVAETEVEARSISDNLLDLIDFDRARAKLSKKLDGVDLSQVDLDDAIPAELLAASTIERGASRYEIFRRMALEERRTLRELLKIDYASDGHWNLVGTPEQVADELQLRFEQGGCDGFVIMPGYVPEGFTTFAEAVVPQLQARGLFKSDYEHDTLRGHLGLERPAHH